MDKSIGISLGISILLIGGAFLVISQKSAGNSAVGSTPTATIVDGKQIIAITAKGGYSPREVVAKAGLPTILRVTTNGTFDCSSGLVIPKLSYQKALLSSGTEDIAIPAEQATGTLQGLCTMGMYNFKILFQ